MEDMKTTMPSVEEQMRLSDLFRMFADTTRIGILSALSASEMCVGDLAEQVGLTVSAVSHQLRLLRSGRLVTCRREGKQMLYALADDHVRIMLKNGMDHIME